MMIIDDQNDKTNVHETRHYVDSSIESLWMLFASFAFAIMGVCVKLASSQYSIFEIVMYRGLIGAVFIYTYIRFQRGSIKTPLPWHHLSRSLIGVTSMWMWFYSISKLPLATAMTLNYMSPIWMAAILFVWGWSHGQTRFEWGLVAAIIMSFVGVILLLRPAMNADLWFGGLVALTSGILAAIAYLQVRHLGQLGEPDTRVVFYLSVTGLAFGLLGTFFGTNMPADKSLAWHAHSATGIVLLISMGASATVAQLAMTRAYHLGKTLLTANLQYTGIIFSSLWGILIWSDMLSWLGWIGIVVVLISGVVATFYNTQKFKSENRGLTTERMAADPISTEI